MNTPSEGEAYYRLLFKVTPLPALVYDLTTFAILNANNAAVETYGFTREEFLQVGLQQLLSPSDFAHLQKLVTTNPHSTQSRETWKHRKKSGEWFDVECNAYTVQLGPRLAQLVVIQDISERLQQEAKLRDSERYYRELCEQAHDAIYTQDLQGRLTSMNEAGERLMGYSRDELLRMNLMELLSPEDQELARQMMLRKLSGAATNTIFELRVRTKTGELLPVEISSTLILQEGRPIGAQGIARDLTNRKRMEDHMRQVQKMDAVGRLAGGVAHDFNNRLTAILGFTDLLLRRADKNEQQRYYLEQIKQASERATELTRQLLTFSRKQVVQPQMLNLNEAVSDWANLVRVLLGENIEVQIILGSEVGLVKADPGQLEHVIMNLAINACDAMPNGGSFMLETTDIEISDLQAQFHPAIPAGNYVRLLVKDTGCGMSKETLTHLFEPFFTTKERGKGTGLGLFTAYGIIKQSGGYIEVKSAEGEGTAFLIYLPVREDAQSINARQAAASAHGGGTIMLVEDEPTVRQLVCEVLESAGYTVLEAEQGLAALEIAAHHAGNIELLLTDIRMPGLNGYDLAERLKALRPTTRVLFMSAYTDDARVAAASRTVGFAYLQKPFSVETLIQKVRAVLEQGKGKAVASG